MNKLGVQPMIRSTSCGAANRPKSGSPQKRNESSLRKSAERRKGVFREKEKMVNTTRTDQTRRSRTCSVENASVIGQTLSDPYSTEAEKTNEKRILRNARISQPSFIWKMKQSTSINGKENKSSYNPDTGISAYFPMCVARVSSFNECTQSHNESRHSKGTHNTYKGSSRSAHTSDVDESTKSTRFFITQTESLNDLECEFERENGEIENNDIGNLLGKNVYEQIIRGNKRAQSNRAKAATSKTRSSSSSKAFTLSKNKLNPLVVYNNHKKKPVRNPEIWSQKGKEHSSAGEGRDKVRRRCTGENNENKTSGKLKDNPGTDIFQETCRKYTITLSLPTVELSEESKSSASVCGEYNISRTSSSIIAGEIADYIESDARNDLLCGLISSSISATYLCPAPSPKPSTQSMSNPGKVAENESLEISKCKKPSAESRSKNESQNKTTTNTCYKIKPVSQAGVLKDNLEMLASKTQTKQDTNLAVSNDSPNNRSNSNKTTNSLNPKVGDKSHTLKTKPKSIQELVHESRGTRPNELYINPKVKVSSKRGARKKQQMSDKKRELCRKTKQNKTS